MRKSIASLLVAAGLVAVSGAASARTHVDVGISFGVPAPVYYAPPPVAYYPRPVYVEPAPVYYAPAPVYYDYGGGWVPPGHRKHWKHRHHRGDWR